MSPTDVLARKSKGLLCVVVASLAAAAAGVSNQVLLSTPVRLLTSNFYVYTGGVAVRVAMHVVDTMAEGGAGAGAGDEEAGGGVVHALPFVACVYACTWQLRRGCVWEGAPPARGKRGGRRRLVRWPVFAAVCM